MNKIYWIFIVVMAALAIWGTEKALGQTTTTILAPDGSVTVCQVGSNGIVICV
jgi:quinol-cytochrome oxidoreductase complex cytochrome b subunit